MIRLKALVIAGLLVLPTALYAETFLLMAEEEGCVWCAKWNQEIAPIYPKTSEGQLAPLRRYDLHSETPDVQFMRRVHFTPTFILVTDGQEMSRIEGYPGPDFFWGLLAMMIEKAHITFDGNG